MLSAPVVKAWIMSVRDQGQEVISDDWHDDGWWMSGCQTTSQDDIRDDDKSLTGQMASSALSRHYANIIIINIIYTRAHNLDSPLR